jgi:hypothetical protein
MSKDKKVWRVLSLPSEYVSTRVLVAISSKHTFIINNLIICPVECTTSKSLQKKSHHFPSLIIMEMVRKSCLVISYKQPLVLRSCSLKVLQGQEFGKSASFSEQKWPV